jgi:predicted enzyme related to lactoylglutathione lyase
MSAPPAAFLGLRTAIYVVDDLAAARDWYAGVVGAAPYFDEPFYVGFSVGGFELGLMATEGADAPGVGGTRVYWGVSDADAALGRLVAAGATVRDDVQDVGGGIRTATVTDPFGNVLGVIENPHFDASAST